MNTDIQYSEVEIHDQEIVVDFESLTDTLVVDDVAVSFDLQLGDDDLGVSLLLESLEQQYEDMVSQEEAASGRLGIQSVKEWLEGNKEMIPGLFRYLRSLAEDRVAA